MVENEQIIETTANESGTEDFLKYWRSLINHKWLVLTLFCLALTLSTFHYYRLPDYYVASARVLVHKIRDKSVMPYAELSAQQSWDSSYYETQVEVIKGLTVCERVAENLNLKEHYGVSTNKQAAKIIRGKIRSRLIRKTRIIIVSVTDGDPKMAVSIANGVIESYIEEAMKDRMFVSEQILEWFPDVKAIGESNPKELIKKINNEEIAQKLPSVLKDPIIRKLKERKIDLQAQLESYLTRYTPEHPQVKELTGRLQFIKREISIQINKITASIKTALAGELNVSNIKVLEKASIPGGPAGPNRKRGIIQFTLIGTFIGIFLAIFIDSLDKTIKTDEDILGIPGLPFLGGIPTVDIKKRKKGEKNSSDLLDLLNDQSMLDSMNTLNTSLLFSMPKGQNKLIMVTSTIPAEGKTTISCLLAASMAKLGNRVLLVEIDLRRPSLHEKLILKSGKKKGMADLLVGQANLDEIIFPLENSPNLDIVLSGGSSPNPVSLITSKAFDEFIKQVEQKYDRVFFDTPPSIQIPDAIVLANKMHGLIYIIGAGMIHRKIMLKTLQKFRFVGSSIFGAVINRINLKTFGYGSSAYYYGKYYGRFKKYYKK